MFIYWSMKSDCGEYWQLYEAPLKDTKEHFKDDEVFKDAIESLKTKDVFLACDETTKQPFVYFSYDPEELRKTIEQHGTFKDGQDYELKTRELVE